ncbi:hypothetical protein MTO96_022916 [Rhipicephalus appendiculatus]
MAESRDDSKMAPSTPASVARSRGAGGRSGSSSTSRSASSVKTKASVDTKKRKQRKLPGRRSSRQPRKTCSLLRKQASSQPANRLQKRARRRKCVRILPTSAPQGRSRDVSVIATPAKSPTSAPPSRSGDISAIVTPGKTPTSAPQGRSRDVSASVTPAKTLSSEPLGLQHEATFRGKPATKQPETPRKFVTQDSVSRKALTPEPPIPPRDVTRESTAAKEAQPSQPPGDDVHDLVAQVAAQPPESMTVPTVSKWSLRRPTRRVFNIGQKYGKGKTGKFCKVLLLGAAVLTIGVALAKYFSRLKHPPPYSILYHGGLRQIRPGAPRRHQPYGRPLHRLPQLRVRRLG